MNLLEIVNSLDDCAKALLPQGSHALINLLADLLREKVEDMEDLTESLQDRVIELEAHGKHCEDDIDKLTETIADLQAEAKQREDDCKLTSARSNWFAVAMKAAVKEGDIDQFDPVIRSAVLGFHKDTGDLDATARFFRAMTDLPYQERVLPTVKAWVEEEGRIQKEEEKKFSEGLDNI